MKMHPSHRSCLAALLARSRTIDLRGNVTHTGNLGSVPKRSVVLTTDVRRQASLTLAQIQKDASVSAARPCWSVVDFNMAGRACVIAGGFDILLTFR